MRMVALFSIGFAFSTLALAAGPKPCQLELFHFEELSMPAGLSYFSAEAHATGPTSGEVRWQAPEPGIEWRVTLATGDLIYFSPVAKTTQNVVTFTDLIPGTTYDGYVTGTSADGQTFYRSSTIYIDTPPGPAGQPLADPRVTRFEVASAEPEAIELRFDTNGAQTITLERRLAGIGDFSPVATLFGQAIEHRDGGLSPDTPYEYRLLAERDGKVAFSAIVAARTAARPTLNVATGALAPTSLVVVAPVSGRGKVEVFDAASGRSLGAVEPFPGESVGSIAVADVNGDGVLDLVAGSGAGTEPRVRAIDGKNASELWTRRPFEPTFLGGVEVAVGDVDADGKLEVIAAAGVGGGPRVRVLTASDGKTVDDFFAFDPSSRGGARVAVGDVDGDGKAELIVGSGPGLAPQVRVFAWRDGTRETSEPTDVLEKTFLGGVFVGAGDWDGDGRDDLIVTAGPGGAPRARVFDLARPDVSKIDRYLGEESSRDGATAVLVKTKAAVTVFGGVLGAPASTLRDWGNASALGPSWVFPEGFSTEARVFAGPSERR